MTKIAVWPFLAMGAGLFTGCGSEPGWDLDPEPIWSSGQGERIVVPLAYDTLFHRHGREDESLVRPSLIRRTDSGLAVVDRLDQTITLYAPDGSRVWTTGREGQGPGEFQNVRDLRVSPGGGLVVYDIGNRKLAELDASTGAIRSETRIPPDAGAAESMVPLGDTVLLVTFRPAEPLVAVSLADGTMRALPMPWAGFAELHALHRQGITVAEGSRWAYLFRFGNGYFPFEGTESVGYLGQWVEHMPFPALAVSQTSDGYSTSFRDAPVCSACSASLLADTLFVHFGGETEHAARVLDAYDIRTGAYLVSYELPTFFSEVEVGPDWIAGLREDPYPELILLDRGEPVVQ